MKNLFLRKKNVLILFWRKKGNLFQLFDDSGWGEEKNISAPFSSFYSKGKKMSQRFLTPVVPLGTLHSFISFSLLMDDEKHSVSQSYLLLSLDSFSSFRLERDGGKAARWYVPSSLLF